MKKFNIFLSLLTGIAASACVFLGVYEGINKNFDESCYYLLLCIINYMTFLDCMNDKNKKE